MLPDDLVVVALDSTHHRAAFSCGEASLDRYLQQQVNQDRKRDLSRCYVLVEQTNPNQILGFYTLSAFSVDVGTVPQNAAKGVPYPTIPCVLIGRLAVSQQHQGRKLGGLLLSAAVEHTLHLKERMGIRLIVVDALNAKAAQFYEHYGFQRFPADTMKLFLPLSTALMKSAN